MKIAIVCYEYPPIGGGGGRAARDVARALVRRGHNVRVYTAALGFGVGVENDMGVQVSRSFAFRARPFRCSVPEMAGYLLGSIPVALRDLAAWRPDVIHAHFAVPSGVLAYVLSRLLGVPYVITAQLGDVPGAMGKRTEMLFRILNPVIRPIWKSAAARTACSQFTAELARRAYNCPVEVIYNGIDLPDELPPTLSPSAVRRFIFTGRLDPQKNLLCLLHAFANLPQSHHWRMDFVGDGPERVRLEKLASSLGLMDRICFRGWVTPEQVRDFLQQAEVFVIPSRQEGMPLAVLEALRAGLAVIGSDIGGLADVLRPYVNGLSFRASDPDELCQCLSRMIEDPGFLSEMRAGSRQLVREFDISKISASYEAVLGRVSHSALDSLG